MQKHRLLEQALPSLFPFSLPPPPPLFAPAMQATNTQVPASNKTLTNSRWRISIFQISSGWHLYTHRLGYKV